MDIVRNITDNEEYPDWGNSFKRNDNVRCSYCRGVSWEFLKLESEKKKILICDGCLLEIFDQILDR